MNIIHIALLIGLVLVAVNKGNTYFTLRNKPEEERDKGEYNKAKRAFLWSTAVAVVYACIKLS